MTRAELRALHREWRDVVEAEDIPRGDPARRETAEKVAAELPALLDELDAAEAAHATTRDLAQARIAELEAAAVAERQAMEATGRIEADELEGEIARLSDRNAGLEAELRHAQNNLAQMRAGGEVLAKENDHLRARLAELPVVVPAATVAYQQHYRGCETCLSAIAHAVVGRAQGEAEKPLGLCPEGQGLRERARAGVVRG